MGKDSTDSRRPKRPLSAYLLFVKTNLERLREKNGHSASKKHMLRIAAIEWKKLADKSEFEKMAAEDRQRYEREKEAARCDRSG